MTTRDEVKMSLNETGKNSGINFFDGPITRGVKETMNAVDAKDPAIPPVWRELKRQAELTISLEGAVDSLVKATEKVTCFETKLDADKNPAVNPSQSELLEFIIETNSRIARQSDRIRNLIAALQI